VLNLHRTYPEGVQAAVNPAADSNSAKKLSVVEDSLKKYTPAVETQGVDTGEGVPPLGAIVSI
jgi:hypothetical protein